MSSCRTEPYEKLVLELDTARDGKEEEIIQGEALYIESISSDATLTVKLNKQSADELSLNEEGGFRFIKAPFQKLFFTHSAQTGLTVEMWILRKGTVLIKESDFQIQLDTLKTIEIVESMPDPTPKGSEGTAFRQVAGAGAEWVSPDSHVDDDGDWASETLAYDDDTDTDAYTQADALDYGWCGFLTFTLTSPVRANKIRYFVSANAPMDGQVGRKIDIDVYKEGSWEHVAEITDYTEDAWDEASFPEGSVEKWRMRFHSLQEDKTVFVYETKLYRVATSGGEANVVAEQSDPTLLKMTATQAISPVATTPLLRVKVLTSADTEYSQALTANVRKVLVMCRDGTPFRMAWATGVGTVYFTVKEDGVYYEENIKVASPTLYFQCDEAGKVIEILEWT